MTSDQTEILWQRTEDPKPIKLTVGLPAYNAHKTIWLPLESYKNQIDVDFGWELIIWEEYGPSRQIILKFAGQLPMCQKIKYRSLSKKIPLMHKWHGIAHDADPKSDIFVMQAADDYSPPKRLSIHYQHFTNDQCIFSTQERGLFFHLLTKQKIVYNMPGRVINLNMAYRLKDFKRVPLTNRRESIDGHIRYAVMKFSKGVTMKDSDIDPENWKYSFFTDGANNISLKRYEYYNRVKEPFVPYHTAVTEFGYHSMETYLPANVLDFLNNYS